jgi:hypothetical protein
MVFSLVVALVYRLALGAARVTAGFASAAVSVSASGGISGTCGVVDIGTPSAFPAGNDRLADGFEVIGVDPHALRQVADPVGWQVSARNHSPQTAFRYAKLFGCLFYRDFVAHAEVILH